MADKEEENIVDESKLQQFCAVTGAEVDVARELLQVCQGNLEMAIGMHMDSPCDAVPRGHCPLPQGASCSLGSQAGPVPDLDDSDAVRAPIPQTREILVEESANLVGFRPRRRAARSVFDGFRDFQAEARQQEQTVTGGDGDSSKQRTLEDLFRPPIDMTYKGTFQTARDTGSRKNKWLLVNIQNVQEFPCQVLNRDIWSCPHIRKIVKEHFIFWQVYHDSAEGKKYMQFYKINDWPYVAIVDPRTGENLADWTKFSSASSFLAILRDFLLNHANPDTTDNSPPDKRLKREPSIVDASEEDQIEMAIQASLKQHTGDESYVFVDTESEGQSEDLETFSDSNDAPSMSSYSSDSKQSLRDSSTKGTCDADVVPSCSTSGGSSGSARVQRQNRGDAPSAESGADTVGRDGAGADTNKRVNGHKAKEEEEEEEDGEKTKEPEGQMMNLLIRFPDGAKDHLSISSTAKMKALLNFIISKGIKEGDFELLTNFPRRQLHLLAPSTTLVDAGLHAKDTLFVHCI